MARVWPGAIVEENKLQVHISALRRALGPDRGTLRTSFGRGYRLVGDWAIRKESAPADPVVLDPARIPVQFFPPNVPAAGSELLGRAAAVQQLQEVLSACRAITLTGPGGIGKTVLALEVTRSLIPTFHGDCWVVDLVSLSTPGLVPSMVAGVLGSRVPGNEISTESVARMIGGRKLLLVLDNCEHVIDEAAKLAETIVRRCPHAYVLATSREVLRIDGEHVYRVPPLVVPACDEQEPRSILGHSAVQLFVARMRALDSDFSPDAQNIPAIVAICRRLDGIPLAIEFAAARAAALGLQQVVSRLEDRFALLTGGRRTALPRHQTLRATLDWSYELLPEIERSLLRRLGIFAAGFTLEAATAIMDKGHAANVLLEQIANLVAKSLVTLDGSAPSGRWRLLDTIRAYALEKLAQTGETDEIARRCAEFFRDLVAPATYGSPVPCTAESMARYRREIENVRVALDWSFSGVGDAAVGIDLTSAYAPVWLDLSLLAECRERIERALDRLEYGQNLGPTAMQLRVSLGIALIFTMGPIDRVRMVLSQALEAAEGLNDVGAVLEILFALLEVSLHCGECHEAQSIAGRFLTLALRTGEPALVPIGHWITGNTVQYGGNQRDAQKSFEHMLGADVAPEYKRHRIGSRCDLDLLGQAALARTLWLRGWVDQGVTRAQASLEKARAAGHKPTLCWVVHYGAYPVALMTGDLVAAGQAVTLLTGLATSLSTSFWKNVGLCLEGKLLIQRGEFALGSLLLRTALDTCERTGWTTCHPEFLGALAEGLAGVGQLTEAIATIDRALASADRGGERWFVAELLRNKGELWLRVAGDQSIPAAERCFCAALEVAREQEALSWELRVALSFARLRVRQNRRDEARQLLASVYNRFTEGFETLDLLAAHAMLQSPPCDLGIDRAIREDSLEPEDQGSPELGQIEGVRERNLSTVK